MWNGVVYVFGSKNYANFKIISEAAKVFYDKLHCSESCCIGLSDSYLNFCDEK